MGRKLLPCHCQLEPKVPRPKNAFLLYRQANYKAAAATQSLPVSSRAISKILGKEWNELPARSKAGWVGIAEEERRQYQQQYDKIRCSRCGRQRTVRRSIEGSGGYFDSSLNGISDMGAPFGAFNTACKAPGYQGQATVDPLALSSAATLDDGKEQPFETHEAAWTLCAVLLPNNSSPLGYYMIHILGLMDTVSQETVSFILTGETIHRLAEYYNAVCTVPAQQQRFLTSLHAYRYQAGHDEVLDAIESNGNGEFKGNQSDAAKQGILGLFDILD